MRVIDQEDNLEGDRETDEWYEYTDLVLIDREGLF